MGVVGLSLFGSFVLLCYSRKSLQSIHFAHANAASSNSEKWSELGSRNPCHPEAKANEDITKSQVL